MQGRRLIGYTVAMAMAGMSAISFGQAAGSPTERTTWDIFAGASFVRLADDTVATTESGNRNATGWDLSVSERPYERYQWLGGTIEGSGAYSSNSYTLTGASYSQAQHLYTFMGGPMVMVPRGRVQPFGRVLFGDTFGYNSVSANASTLTPITATTTPMTTTTRAFAIAFGGGADVMFSRAWGLRAQADWIDGHQTSTQRSGSLRASVGATYKF